MTAPFDPEPGLHQPGPGSSAGAPLDDDACAAVDAELADVVAEATAQSDALAAMAAERDDYLDSLRRLQADFENYKKRVLRQQAEQSERAAEALVERLLPVLDTAELALAHGVGDDVAQLHAALFDILAREGLERIHPAGEAFDPNVADAVAREPGDDGTMTVSEVMRSGYRWKGRVLRPAMVKVRG